MASKKIVVILVLIGLAQICQGRSEISSKPSYRNHVKSNPTEDRGRPQAPIDGKAKPQGRTLGVIADLFLSAHCSIQDCQKSSSRADFCCSRSFNPQCCSYSQSSNSNNGYYHQHQHYHNLQYPHNMYQQYPGINNPQYPGQNSPQYPGHNHPQYPGHSNPQYPGIHPNLPNQPYPLPSYPPMPPPYPIGPVAPPYPQGIQKPGSCPQTSRSDWSSNYLQQDYFGSKSSSSQLSGAYTRSCSYDFECPLQEKCCHAEIHRGVFTMSCQYPTRASPYYY